MAEKRKRSADYRFRLYLRPLEVCVAQTVVYCPPVHPHDLCMYIRYNYPLTVDSRHDTGFTWCHTDNPAITPIETRLSIGPPPQHSHSHSRSPNFNNSTSSTSLWTFMSVRQDAALFFEFPLLLLVHPAPLGLPVQQRSRASICVKSDSDVLAPIRPRDEQPKIGPSNVQQRLDTVWAGDGGSYRLYRLGGLSEVGG